MQDSNSRFFLQKGPNLLHIIKNIILTSADLYYAT